MALRFLCAMVLSSARCGVHMARISTSAIVLAEMCVHVHAFARGVLPKCTPRTPCMRQLSGCYSTHRASYSWLTLAFVPTCLCTPRGVCSSGATIPTKRYVTGGLWHLPPPPPPCHCMTQVARTRGRGQARPRGRSSGTM